MSDAQSSPERRPSAHVEQRGDHLSSGDRGGSAPSWLGTTWAMAVAEHGTPERTVESSFAIR